MSSGSVQFRGIAQVMKAFENRQSNGWAIWCKNQFMFKGMGEDELRTLLKALYASSSNSVYTIKVYDDVASAKAIKEKTESDGSFNFRFHADEDEIPNPGYQTIKSNNNQVLGAIQALNARIDMMQEEKETAEEEEKKKPSALGWVGELMTLPGVAPAIGQLLPALFGNLFKTPAQNNYVQPGTIAGIPAVNLSEVIQELQKHDPELLKHLNKLLSMARDKPHNFAFLLQTLDGM